MRLDGRRESSNVEDRRGSSGGGSSFGGMIPLGGGGGRMGCGTIIIVLAFLFLMTGGDLGKVLQIIGGGGTTSEYVESSSDGSYVGSEEEEELALFTRQILASTEDVWDRKFEEMGRTYDPPTLVMYTGSIQTGCGAGSAAMGPFYCSADQKVYIDLSFFRDMKKTLGADGDFAYAYVIAHEVGHHVEHLLGILDEAHAQMSRVSETEKNKLSVRIELLADFYAGVWGYHENAMFGSLEEGDLEEAINAAQKIGDDYLQKKARGYSMPESFTHGTSAQRIKWLKKGLKSGNMKEGDTFSVAYGNL